MSIFLSALIPAVLAILFIMYMDRYKPEPIKCLIWAFVAGMASVIPAIILEMVFSPILDVTPAGSATSAAVFEELSKFFVLWIVIRKFKTLDEYIDGIVYAVCAGVGFEFVENIEYFIDSYESINSRTLLPAHFIFAIFMGYYLGKAHFATGNEKKKLITLSLLAPMFIHFIWDYILFNAEMFYENDIIVVGSLLAFFVFYILIIRKSIKYVKENRKADADIREKERIDEINRIKAEAVAEYISDLDKEIAVKNLEENNLEQNSANNA